MNCRTCDVEGASKRISGSGNESVFPYCDRCWGGVPCLDCGALMSRADAGEFDNCRACGKLDQRRRRKKALQSIGVVKRRSKSDYD